MPRALITGVTGQDGSYLAELLLGKDYDVFGLVRRTSQPHVVMEGVRVLHGDLTDQGSLNRAVFESIPDEVYNLAAQSFVGESWQYPVSTSDITALGALRLLEACRLHNPKAKLYQASSSEMFGNFDGVADESSAFKPRSPYGTAKVFAHNSTVNYRESYGMPTYCGILFNHESPRRGIEFVSRKIARAVGKIYKNEQSELFLGSLTPLRDFGYAKDYVEAIWQIMQGDPNDYVVASGESHSIEEFVEGAFEVVGLDWHNYVKQDTNFIRPAEINNLRGNASKIKREIGWQPKTSFKELVKIMVEAEL